MAGRISRWSFVVVLGSAALLIGSPPAPASAPPDRLQQFRDLARRQLAAGEASAAAYQAAYELLDGEVIENLASGSVFASVGFLQERLHAFAEVWGGADVQLIKTGDVVVGAFRLAGAPEGASVRVYGRDRGEPSLLTVRAQAGDPTVYGWRPGPDGAPQYLVLWEGERSPRGTTPLRAELTRITGGSARVVWSAAGAQEIHAWSGTVRLPAISLRYELRYPGWAPGCEGQTEQEDLYRYSSARHSFTLARRRLHRPWHRQLRAAADRLFTAVRETDDRRLAQLVPDARVREKLPAGLEPEPACDAAEGALPETASVAAMVARDRQPWVLSFRRTGAAWRLIEAGPVLE